jgi:ligand-binding sensor domain-containing protein/signal transduction histidine kinase
LKQSSSFVLATFGNFGIRSRVKRALLLFACTLAAALPSRSLDAHKALTQYAHRIWGQQEGLFQPTIYSILQTRDGFLWLGTQDSLIRFDGVHFREFEGRGAGFFHNALIRTLVEDERGTVWVGSVGSGLSRIDANGRVNHYSTANGLPSDTVFCVDAGRAGETWVCTDKGLARFAEGRFHTFTAADGLPSDQVRSTCIASGTRWVAGIDFGLATWDGRRFHPYSSNLTSLDRATALACGNDGSVWAGTDAGLLHIGADRSRLLTTREGLPDNAVSSLLAARDGTVWVGTYDGVTRVRGKDASVYRTRDGLSHSLVLSLYIDREGTLWAGTKDGLDQFTDGNVTPYTTNEGLSSNDTGPVLEDAEGRLYIGTLGCGLNIFENGKFRSIAKRDGLADNTVLSLELDDNRNLWVGTKRGLTRIRDGHVVASYGERNGLSGLEVRSLFVDSQGTLWAGTERGLNRFENKRFKAVALAPGENTGSVVALAGGRTVRVFASTESADFYAMRGDSFAPYSLGTARPVDCYLLDHVRHSTWMGTLGGGLLRWQNGNVAHVRVKDGLYDNRIYQILDDGEGNFWIASSKGIFRVSHTELDALADGRIRAVTSVPFTTGQLRFECRSGVQPAACRTRDGRLWFSTTSGLVEIDPRKLSRNTVAPPAAITAVLVNGERRSSTHILDLTPNQRNVEIRYAGLSYVAPEKVTFRYKLDGFETNWTEAGSRREAFFTNLPPRHFRFLVYARNADSHVSAEPAVFEFTIEPKLYQRVWFWPLVTVLLTAAGFAIYRIRVQQLRERFDVVLAERSRIARELHDTLLQGLSGVTMQLHALWMRMPPSRDRQFLASIIDDAAACSQEARKSLWGLRNPKRRDEQFADKLAALCREALRSSGVELKLDLRPFDLDAYPETEYQILRIAREVVSNTAAHAKATVLHVELSVHKGHLHLSFRDNGIGFDVQSGSSIPDHFGLVGIRERAQEIGAELGISSSPGAGTSVVIDLQLTNASSCDSNAEMRISHHIG